MGRSNTTSGLVLSILFLACIALPQPPRAQRTPVMPSWLLPFPGASEQTRQSSVLVESTYAAAAKPREVVDHYRRLFASAGLPFRPDPLGYGFMIQAAADACNLTITIRNRNETSAVRVVCAAKMAQPDRANRERDAETDRKVAQAMEKYDQPVYPQSKPHRPPPSWPDWLVHIQGGRLQIQTAPVQGGASYLKSAYTSGLGRAALQSFYANMLAANGYKVDSQSLASLPKNFRAFVEGSAYPDGRPGRRTVIRVALTPADNAITVELRVMAFP